MADALYKLLATFGFTDPVHAIFVHLPIGLVISALIFLLVSVIWKREHLAITARHVSILAFIFVFPTIIAGVIDWQHFYHGALVPQIKAKIALASVVTVVLLVGVVFGGKAKLRNALNVVIYVLAFFAVIALGYFGGRLVYGGRSAGSEAAASPAQLSQQAKAGEAAFTDNCSGCHQGGGNSIAADYTLKASKKLVDAATFTAFVRKPTMRDGSVGGMPAFASRDLSDAQVGDIYAYVAAMVSTAWK
jgi:mono/diheme cytochrome c family protein